jgi:hypothetical protein
MPEDLTADELVKLAKLCGYEEYAVNHDIKGDPEYVQINTLPDDPYHTSRHWPEWQPHLDANQRDEVVNSICKNWPDLCVALSRQNSWAGCEIVKDEELIAYKQADTAGLAVCRAALKALER